MLSHHQKRASSLVSPAGSSSVMEATRSGARSAGWHRYRTRLTLVA
jgi:hypothetical protein